MISTKRHDSDEENNYVADGARIREPLLNSQRNQPSGLTNGEGRATLSDIWATRIRQKVPFIGNAAYVSAISSP